MNSETVGYVNDGSGKVPALRVYLNTDNLVDLPAWSLWGREEPAGMEDRLLADGFEGVQLGNPSPWAHPTARMPYCGLDRINQPEEAATVFARHRDRGDQCLTLHVGWGLEEDAEVDHLVEAILAASERTKLPAFVETHRATLTQDMWRTVQLTRRFPEIRFNIDLSHYYCGQEMVYGDFEQKLEFLQPVLERTGFMHGRVAAPGFMQAPIEDGASRPRMATGVDYLAHFREMWIRAMGGFLAHAGPGDLLIFAPELLRAEIYYARVLSGPEGRLEEESDRYAEALLYRDLARELFAEAAARGRAG